MLCWGTSLFPYLGANTVLLSGEIRQKTRQSSMDPVKVNNRGVLGWSSRLGLRGQRDAGPTLLCPGWRLSPRGGAQGCQGNEQPTVPVPGKAQLSQQAITAWRVLQHRAAAGWGRAHTSQCQGRPPATDPARHPTQTPGPRSRSRPQSSSVVRSEAHAGPKPRPPLPPEALTAPPQAAAPAGSPTPCVALRSPRPAPAFFPPSPPRRLMLCPGLGPGPPHPGLPPTYPPSTVAPIIGRPL